MSQTRQEFPNIFAYHARLILQQDISQNSATPTSRSSLKPLDNMVTLIGIEKGESLDKMTKSTTIRMEDIETVKAVRDKLGETSSIKDSDRFLTSQGYPMEREDEEQTDVEVLLTGGASVKKEGEKEEPAAKVRLLSYLVVTN